MYRPAELEPEVHPRTLLADHRTRRGTAGLDRVAGLEPTPLPCIGSALPLSYTRLGNIPNILCAKYVWLMSFVKGLSRFSSYEPGGKASTRAILPGCAGARPSGGRPAWGGCGALADASRPPRRAGVRRTPPAPLLAAFGALGAEAAESARVPEVRPTGIVPGGGPGQGAGVGGVSPRRQIPPACGFEAGARTGQLPSGDCPLHSAAQVGATEGREHIMPAIYRR